MLKIRSNQANKTFTIRKYDENGHFVSKYRTNKMSDEEFEDMDYFTQRDWEYFLRSSEEYYIVK
jgi:hypothetical protein